MLGRPFTVCLALACASAPVPCKAQLAAPDSARLLADLSALAHDSLLGRGAGTEGHRRARAFLERSISASGAIPVRGSYLHPYVGTESSGVNVVGMVPGAVDGLGVVVLTAHYDHLGVRDGLVFNGADDNASGAAALLEIARQLSERPLRHSALIALVDQEEVGLLGARALVAAELVPRRSIALNVNLDMVARTGGVLWAGGAHHTPALGPVLERVADSAPLTLRQGHDRPGATEEDWTWLSDHAAFHEVGIPFVYFGVEDHEDYHRPTDDFERVDPGEYVAAVRTILDALRELDGALPLDAAAR